MANLTAAISLMPISGCARLLGCINKITASPITIFMQCLPNTNTTSRLIDCTMCNMFKHY